MKQNNHLLRQANARVESRNSATSKMEQFKKKTLKVGD